MLSLIVEIGFQKAIKGEGLGKKADALGRVVTSYQFLS